MAHMPGGRGRGPARRRPASSAGGGYPAIGHPQFSFSSLVRQAIESRKPVDVELMNGDTIQVILLREDQFTFTIMVHEELRVLYKHAIKFLTFPKQV